MTAYIRRMSDFEKQEKQNSSSASSSNDVADDGYYTNEVLIDPDEKKSLHRDLSARQISMIAVRSHSGS